MMCIKHTSFVNNGLTAMMAILNTCIEGNMKSTKPKLDKILNNFLSRKLQVVLIATVLFLVTDKFSADNLVVIFGIYIASNVAQKFVDGRPGIQ